MDAVIYGHQRECFEHSIMGVFDITAMREWAVINCKSVLVPLNLIVPFVRTNRVTELERIKSLPDESWKTDPGMFIEIEKHGKVSHLMIDGHHRALRRFDEGEEDMLNYIVPMKFAIRPSAGWIKDPRVDWGDELKDGKIIRR